MLIYAQKNEILFELEFIRFSKTLKKSLYIYHYLYQNSWHLDLRTLLLTPKYLRDDDIEFYMYKRVCIC